METNITNGSCSISYDEHLVSIGEKLCAARKRRSLTQKAVALKVGCTQSYLSAVERGKKQFTLFFVLSLIKIYRVSYEDIFGSNNAVNLLSDNNQSSEKEESLKCFDLLKSLISNTHSEELETGADTYIRLCIYMLFRRLYSENPKNSDRIFSIEENEAYRSLSKIILDTPDQLHTFIASSHINRKNLEIPIEKNQELREFIRECEKLIK